MIFSNFYTFYYQNLEVLNYMVGTYLNLYLISDRRPVKSLIHRFRSKITL